MKAGQLICLHKLVRNVAGDHHKSMRKHSARIEMQIKREYYLFHICRPFWEWNDQAVMVDKHVAWKKINPDQMSFLHG